METSLLAPSDDLTVPFLSSGFPMEEESEFSRIMALQNHDEHILDFQRLIPEDLISLNFEDGRQSRIVVDDKPRGPHLTAVAGTLCLVHLGLVWGSYSAEAWSQMHVSVSIGWQMDYLPFLNQMTDQVIRTVSLASFLQDLDECRSYLLLLLFWTSALLIPCLFMVLSPTLVVGDYIRPLELQKRRVSMNKRTYFELVARFSWLPIFALCLISLSTSLVDLEWTQTTIQVGQQTKNPFAAYVIGTVCGVAMLALLRAPRQENFRIVSEGDMLEIEFSPATPTAVRSPPPQAFRYPWQDAEEEDEEPLMTVLEEDVVRSPVRSPPRPRPLRSDRDFARAARRSNSQSTPDLVEESDERSPSHLPALTYWNKFVVFQTGLLSVVLWIPTMYLPVLHFSYVGMAAAVTKQQSFRLYFWDIPGYIWSQGLEFGTPLWIVLLLALFLSVSLFFLPMAATFQAILAWLGEGALRARSYVWLYTFHPCLGGIVFSVALLATIPSLSSLSVLMFDENTAGICHGVVGDPCLEARGTVLGSVCDAEFAMV
eukprot:scaffold1404_cov166-Amphora_coffeaeformis.AAC.17